MSQFTLVSQGRLIRKCCQPKIMLSPHPTSNFKTVFRTIQFLSFGIVFMRPLFPPVSALVAVLEIFLYLLHGAKRRVKGHLWNSCGLRKENIFQCLLKTKGACEWELWICSPTAPLFVMVIAYRALPLPASVNCAPGTALHITFSSHWISNKWKRGNTIRCDDLFLKHKFFV